MKLQGKLVDTLAHGNRGHRGYEDSLITCADGFTVSVVAGGGTYCTPRPSLCTCAFTPDGAKTIISAHTGFTLHDYPGPYTEVEVGFPSARPEPWEQWAEYVEDPDEPTETIYSYVPVELVEALIASHGGEA